jgi:mono/diheme cytochrome c family protein
VITLSTTRSSGRPRTLPAVLALTVLALAAACSPRQDPADREPILDRGRAVYRASCATCHGVDGRGGIGPALADGRVVERFPDIDDQIELVRSGRGLMPAWGDRLSDVEIRAVVEYERRKL